MYAVIQHGSHQYRVSVGDKLLVDHVDAEVGASLRLDNVLLLADSDQGARTGDELGSAVVIASVVAQRRGRKLRVMTYKAKKRRRRTLGYRSRLTELVIKDIQSDGAKAAPARRERSGAKGRAAAPKPTEAKEAASGGTELRGEQVAGGEATAAGGEPVDAGGAAEAKPKPARQRRTSSTRKTSESATSDGA
jgi:large subunit ribosomal protein L21